MNNKFIASIVLVFIILFQVEVSANSNINLAKTKEDRYAELAKNIEIFTSLYRELNSYYVDDLDPNIVMKSAIDGMLEELDPYTNYIPSSDIDDYEFQTTGKYGGIGAIIGEKDGNVFVRQPYEGSPAQKAGLLSGDIILEIDGKSANNKKSEDIRQLLLGQPNTPVTLKINRAITSDTLTFTFNREQINIGNVPYYGILKDDIGYIRLDQFTEDASLNVANALKDLKSKNTLKGIVLDLRNNPGGLLQEAVGICNIFIDKGMEVVETRGKVQDVNKKYMTNSKAIDTETPLIVLINEGSASASEIVSGVIQDYDRGLVIGQRTFGKGLVQIPRPLPYKARLKVTAYKYYIPSGRCIQAIDYSNRDNEGKAPIIADSLRKVFYTKSGRPVKDGAGIEPDLKLEEEVFAPISISLYTKDLYFKYANIYRNAHPKLDSNKIFSLSDDEFNQFIEFIADKEYDYTTKTEDMLSSLIETAKDESYYSGISDALDVLKSNMKHDKNQDVVKHKTQIKALLESEIASRYQYQKGKIKVELKYDNEVSKAMEILKDQSEYNKMLTVTQ
ncbi:MAG TPA: S41 family peptidase [Chitinophagales bacterium]|nr:S41 family peptidase [Chitinophagales bacterium]